MLTTVFGRRGSGKTTMIQGMIDACERKPVVVLDILGNYDTPENIKNGWVICYDAGDALSEILEYRKNPKKHSGKIIVKSSEMSRSVDYVCAALWHNEGGTLVLDEVDAISVPEAPCFDEAVRYGRNRNIDIITGCRRPAELSKNITAGSDIAYCLSTHEPRDIMYYREFLGDDLAEELPKLPQYHGICRDFKNQTHFRFKTTENGKIIKIGAPGVILGKKPAPTPISKKQDIPIAKNKKPVTLDSV